MDAVAREAGVGKGTLYRRFGDRAGLARSVIEERERTLQDELIRGEPPLGPGAAPLLRLRAFGHAYLELLECVAPLVVLAESSAPPGAGPYAFYHLHVRLLLQDGAPGCDAELLAHTLLATLGAAKQLGLREVYDIDLERRKAGWDRLVQGCCLSPAV
jgi:AcrR family transcriptional regulator